MNFSKQVKSLNRLMAAQTDDNSRVNVVPSTLHTRMSLQEFLAWTDKKEISEKNINSIEEINTLNYLKMNLKTYDHSSSDYDFAFQIRQPLLPVGCASLYLVNQNDENVKVYYKLRCLEKSRNNRVVVHSLAEGVYDSLDKNSSLYLDDVSIKSLKEAVIKEEQNATRPIKIPTGKLTVICDIFVLKNNELSNQTKKFDSEYSKSLILYL